MIKKPQNDIQGHNNIIKGQQLSALKLRITSNKNLCSTYVASN